MPQLLERKRDRQAHLRMSIAYRVFLGENTLSQNLDNL